MSAYHHGRKFWRIVLCTVIFFLQLSTCNFASAQVAGMNTLSLLQMPSSARAAALGGSYLSVFAPDDIHIGLDNPSLISENYNRRLALDYVGMFSGGNFATVAYGCNFERFGTFLFGLRYNGYGTFEGYDETETPQGTFSASDIALLVAWGLNVDSNFSVGASFMPVRSQYESYTAVAFALNVAGSYVSDNRRFAATLQARNIGAQIATFNGMAESLPFDLSATLSYKVSNAPFRLFFAVDQLTKWRLGYDDPLNPETEIDPYTGQPVAKPWYDGISKVLDEVARHAAFGVEVEIKQLFFIRLGYRYRQMEEMSASDRTNINFSGFSYGFGLHTKKFEFSFARRNYHLGQAPNYLSLSFRL